MREISMRRFIAAVIGCMLVLGAGSSVIAKELRLAYVDSDKILEQNDDYKQAKQKLQDEERTYINQASSLEDAVKQMEDELKTQSLMLSDEARKEREQRYTDKVQELNKLRKDVWGEGGKLYNRNLELSKPVLDKINLAIQKVSQESGYDFVFDASSANIVYALPEYDITDKVLDALKKE
jgi:outer membrane protein